MTSQSIRIAFLLLITVQAAWEITLVLLNLRYAHHHREQVPAILADSLDLSTLYRSVDYLAARTMLTLISHAFGWMLLVVIGTTRCLPLIEQWLLSFQLPRLPHGVLFLLLLGLLQSLLNLPFHLWRIFKIETQFGFNQTTPKLFIIDQLKGLGLVMLIGIPALTAILWFITTAGPTWWVGTTLAIAGFQLLLSVVCPTLITPWFNRFHPLPEGPLRDRLTRLVKGANFPLQDILVMDGSKRSNHSNAYFTGLGRAKRVVLFDTLLTEATEPEIEAIVAHEIGHYHHRHLQQGLVLSIFSTLIGLCIVSKLISYPSFFQAFGFLNPSPHAAVTLFGLCFPPATFVFAPLFTALSRRFEYQADRFTVHLLKQATGMIQALKRLVKTNLSTIYPHPLYAAVTYSHPTPIERIERLTVLENPSIAP